MGLIRGENLAYPFDTFDIAKHFYLFADFAIIVYLFVFLYDIDFIVVFIFHAHARIILKK